MDKSNPLVRAGLLMQNIVDAEYFNNEDWDDVSRYVRHKSLAELDKEIKGTSLALKEMQNDKHAKTFYSELLRTLRVARDISEYCFLNDIPTNSWKLGESKIDYRIESIINNQKELSNRVEQLSGKTEHLHQEFHQRSDKKKKYEYYT